MKKVKLVYRQSAPKHYQCACGGEVIQIIKDYEMVDKGKEVSQIFFSMYEYGTKDTKTSLKSKLCHIWRIITTGNPYADSVILHIKVARKLGKDLLNMTK